MANPISEVLSVSPSFRRTVDIILIWYNLCAKVCSMLIHYGATRIPEHTARVVSSHKSARRMRQVVLSIFTPNINSIPGRHGRLSWLAGMLLMPVGFYSGVSRGEGEWSYLTLSF